MKFANVFVISGLLSILAFSAMAFVGPNDQLSHVKKAYLQRDFSKMALAIKSELFTDPNSPNKDEMLNLYAKAREVAGLDGIMADWSLPEEVTKMKIRVRRVQNEGVRFNLSVSGEVKDVGVIDQLKVWQHGGKIFLDKHQGVGEWNEGGKGTKPDKIEYGFRSNKSNQEIQSGLYLLTMTLKNGKSVDGWFILTPDLNASRSPTLQQPRYGQVYKTNKPSFNFENYYSPEYKPHELRALWMGISDEKWETDIWDFWERSPRRNSVNLDDEKAEGKKELSPGNYNFTFLMTEENKFGDIWIGRSAIVHRPFTVE